MTMYFGYNDSFNDSLLNITITLVSSSDVHSNTHKLHRSQADGETFLHKGGGR